MKVLLIDDIRDANYCEITWGIRPTHVARTFAEGIEALKQGGIDTLMLDHDLACYDESGKELTGYGIMLFLEEFPEYLPREIFLVTANPVGRAKMKQVVDKLYGK